MPLPTNKMVEPAGRHIHIVCFDVPFPVDYGGVFDLYYKMEALHLLGVKIHLHCFEYGRARQPKLETLCEEVVYYPRKTGFAGIKWGIPYIVSSRINNALYERLKKDDYPILMEGIHCSWGLFKGLLPKERCLVRPTNVEWKYYRQLGRSARIGFKKAYYLLESRLLKSYEAKMAQKGRFIPLSQKDMQEFVADFGYTDTDFLPLFLPEYPREYLDTMGDYCLYHGNLSVAENEQAAIWIIQNVFKDLNIPLVIAGKNPSVQLINLIASNPNIRLVANPAEAEMQHFIQHAQVHVLPSFNETGIKLKLLNALFMGRHCLVNPAGVAGSGLENCCIIVHSAEEMRKKVVVCFDQLFSTTDFEERGRWLETHFNNAINAQQLLKWMFREENLR